jgi:hypothetical protein
MFRADPVLEADMSGVWGRKTEASLPATKSAERLLLTHNLVTQ